MTALLSPTRQAVAVTPINTGIFTGILPPIAAGGIVSFRVEVDLLTGTFYTSLDVPPTGAFGPPIGDTPSQFVSSMGFILSVFARLGINRTLKVEQAMNDVSNLAAWHPVWLCRGVSSSPLMFRARVLGSMARVSVINNTGVLAISEALELKVLSL